MTPETTAAASALTRRSLRTSAPLATGESVTLRRADYRRLAAEAAALELAPAAADEAPAAVEAPVAAEVLEEVVAETAQQDAVTPESPFDVAARLFSFTGLTSVVAAPAQAVDAEIPVPDEAIAASPLEEAAHAAPRRAPRRPRALLRRIAAGSFSVGVMTIVGALAIVTTTPVAAISAAGNGDVPVTAATPPAAEDEGVQAFVASTKAKIPAIERGEGYGVVSMSELAAASGVTLFAGTWVNDPSAEIQWPFPVGVPVSAGYDSNTYLSEFSSPHRGVDLTPGLGAEVHAIAAGTVRIATEAGGDYGVTVVLDHVVDGQLVSTRYAHMEYGSLTVSAGDTVKVGDVSGTGGQTGKATGPHLHLEVLLGGVTYTDPMAWLEAYTAR